MTDRNNINHTYLSHELERIIETSEESGDNERRITFVVLKTIYEDVRSLRAEVDTIKKNPAFSFGIFAKNNPKAAVILAAVVMILLNMWFVSGWRRPLLLWLGIPAELIP